MDLVNKLPELILSGLIGWVVTVILDPLIKGRGEPLRQVGPAVTITKVDRIVHQHFYPASPHQPRTSGDGEDYPAFMILICVAVVFGVVAIMKYGTLVTSIVRLVVYATAVSTIIFAVRMRRSEVFNSRSWVSRVLIMLLVCWGMLVTVNLVEDGIITSVVRAQQQGYRIASLPDMLHIFGFKTVLHIWYYVVGLMLVIFVALMALLAQLHMSLTGYVAKVGISDDKDWRVSLLAFMGNRSSIVTFIVMISFSVMAYGAAAGWLVDVIKSN